MTALMSLFDETHDRLETCCERLLVRERRPRGRSERQSESRRSENDQSLRPRDESFDASPAFPLRRSLGPPGRGWTQTGRAVTLRGC
jgi:hypothetical protein